MLVALQLRHILSKKLPPQVPIIHLVAIAKTYDELLGWYRSLIVPKYEDLGPNLAGGESIPYTKFFQKGSTLEWYAGADSLQLNDPHSTTGFITISDLVQFTEDLEEEVADQIKAIHEAARQRLDDYRNNVEPKMITYDITQSTPTIQ